MFSFKIANVTPIHKSSDPNDPENYRPISIILPIVSKCIEYCASEQVARYFNKKPVWLPKNRSTAYRILDLFDRVFAI